MYYQLTNVSITLSYTTLFRSHQDQVSGGRPQTAQAFDPWGQLLIQGEGDEDALQGTLSRSEEHTSELQSRGHLVCRLQLEKKTYIHILYCTSYYVDFMIYIFH